MDVRYDHVSKSFAGVEALIELVILDDVETSASLR
jgi:hypothetical protein